MERLNEDIDLLLDILGNPTRRSILRLLSMEPHYPFQLARQLGISQRAVMKQLEFLEEQGIIRKISDPKLEEQSKGRTRVYFQLSRSMNIFLDISPHGFRVVTPSEAVPVELSDEMKSFMKEIQETIKREDRLANVNNCSFALADIESRISRLESEISYMLEQKRKVMSFLDKELAELVSDYETRIIVRDIAMHPNGITLGELSEAHDLRMQSVLDKLQPLLEQNILVSNAERAGSLEQIRIRFRRPR